MQSRRRDAAPLRSVQWGCQAMREFHDAAARALPVVQGDVEELWPVLWLIPCLRHSLELLDAADTPWPQKVWLLHHVGRLMEKLLPALEVIVQAKGPSRAFLNMRLV